MPYADFLTAAGFIVAIIILRVTHWLEHNKNANSEAANVLPQIWSYYAVSLGLLAIVYVSFADTGGKGKIVDALPFVWFMQMAVMALAEVVVSPIASLYVKVIIGKPESSSWLSCLDEVRITYKEKPRLSSKGKYTMTMLLSTLILITAGLSKYASQFPSKGLLFILIRVIEIIVVSAIISFGLVKICWMVKRFYGKHKLSKKKA